MKEIDIVKRASHINNECLIVLAGNSKVGSEKDSKDSKKRWGGKCHPWTRGYQFLPPLQIFLQLKI